VGGGGLSAHGRGSYSLHTMQSLSGARDNVGDRGGSCNNSQGILCFWLRLQCEMCLRIGTDSGHRPSLQAAKGSACEEKCASESNPRPRPKPTGCHSVSASVWGCSVLSCPGVWSEIDRIGVFGGEEEGGGVRSGPREAGSVQGGCDYATSLNLEVDPQRRCFGRSESDFALQGSLQGLVCVLLLQDLLQSCARGGRRTSGLVEFQLQTGELSIAPKCQISSSSL